MLALHGRANCARRFTQLLGTASVFAIAQATVAHAQTQQQMAATAVESVPEQVLITGSLIRGTVAVGAPVTTLSTQDFAQAGVVSIGDLLTQALPEFANHTTSSSANAGFGNFINRNNIHNLNGVDTRTLMLIDGLKVAPQGQGAIQYDPSIIPSLALDRLDVLADGASATYGSEAVAGVVNLILKRGYDGATVQTTIGGTEGGNFNYDVQGLWGRKWDSGDVMVTVEYGNSQPLKGSKRSVYTQNFTPWGLDNETPLAASFPGTVSTGASVTGTGAATAIASLCANCFAVPRGQNGVGLTWAQIQANPGIGNIINPTTTQEIIPADQWTSSVFTLDYDLTPWLQFNAEGYYSLRRDQTHNPDVGLNNIAVPTFNPFYPVGAPAGLRINYTFQQLPNIESAWEGSSRYDAGFTIKLPYTWEARIIGGTADEETRRNDVSNLRRVNPNNVSAALGWTIPATAATPANPGLPAFTKPANLPYLNLFCDPTASSCISQDLLTYIDMPNTNNAGYRLSQANAVLDGPVYDLPGGTVKVAVGADYQHENYWINTTTTPVTSQVPVSSQSFDKRDVWAGFGQINIPVIGDANKLPFVERLELEASFRYDHYGDFGGTSNPRVSLDWNVAYGFIGRFSWGTNFVAPSFKAIDPVLSHNITPFNSGSVNVSTLTACPSGANSPAPGSVAAILNPNCTGSTQPFSTGNPNFPLGIQDSSSGGYLGVVCVTRPCDYTLLPETARDLAVGFEWAPAEGPVSLLRGLDIQATYWITKIANPIVGLGPTAGSGLNDPLTRSFFLLPGDPGFANAVQAVLTAPTAGSNIVGITASQVKWVEDGADRNEGYRSTDGVDFNASYVWDLGDFGAWNTGVTGTYYIHDYTQLVTGQTAVDAFNTLAQVGALTTREQRFPKLRYRARLGWADGPFSVTAFMDYTAHIFDNNVLPASQFTSGFPNLVTNPRMIDLVPAQYLFDLALGYNTGETPAETYLRNINVFLTVDNIFDRNPPFAYGGSGNAFAFYAGGTGTAGAGTNPVGRFWRLGVTKQF